MSALNPKGRTVRLGERDYVVRPLKYRRVFALKDFIFDTLADADRLNLGALIRAFTTTDEVEKADPAQELQKLKEIVELLLLRAGKLFAIAIPEVDEKIFTLEASEEESPDIDQMWEAFDAVLEVNHLQFAKNALGRRPVEVLTTMP